MPRLRRLLIWWFVVVVAANSAFWIAVNSNLSMVNREYSNGRVIQIGSWAFVFGHGDWVYDNGILRHMTDVRYHAKGIREPTLQFIRRLEGNGARWIWGTWCFSGDYDFVEYDVVNEEKVLWPRSVSRNTKPGKTFPIWLGPNFIRLSFGDRDVLKIPERPTFRNDTLRFRHREYHLGDINEVGGLMRSIFWNETWLEPDSVVVPEHAFPDTVKYRSQYAYHWDVKRWESDKAWKGWFERGYIISELQRVERDSIEKNNTKLIDTRIWLRGRSFTRWVLIEPVLIS